MPERKKKKKPTPPTRGSAYYVPKFRVVDRGISDTQLAAQVLTSGIIAGAGAILTPGTLGASLFLSAGAIKTLDDLVQKTRYQSVYDEDLKLSDGMQYEFDPALGWAIRRQAHPDPLGLKSLQSLLSGEGAPSAASVSGGRMSGT